ncbi:FAD/FMN-containing dehydrogenase [Penicillium malachiteum]|uniref:FAD/FMN-containing dehydrogenase n=1 Tax=Penicillium malachiteum TaxID=1324776 RepID=UPI00254719AC|nr:FAD/FMN-containing dehydrogenase [Penicillium malachiteum]KAJ5715966.1 FAD/FMN-containing dehydrogenase [Penicillium malachiteum]
MAGFYANESCDPFLTPSARCVIGTYVQYSVRAESALDVQKTMNFTTTHRIRLVVRNTGHDYLGKSTGAGALAIWTHHLKEIQFLDYHSPSYSGKAVKLGAGVQMIESNAAAHKQGLTIVGGNARSVGIAGGYSQGGGHGQLVSQYGLAADQVLEWEVVTGSGELLIATPHNEHADLWWALSGGGGGTYGVVISMTSKVHPELHTATANLTFSSVGSSQEAFYGAVQTFLNSTLGHLLDARGAAVWYIIDGIFEMTPITLPGGSKQRLQSIMRPLLSTLKQGNISYTYHIQDFPTWYSSFQAMSPEVNVTEYNMGGRFIPRRVIDTQSETLVDQLKSIADAGAVISGISVNASLLEQNQSSPSNAVNPTWRTAAIDIVVGKTLSRTNQTLNIQYQKDITNILLPKLERLTPRGGAYLNEGDAHQPDWKYTFYNTNYDRLLQVKNKYDPNMIFYATTAVGSDYWEESEDGALCRAEV